MDISISYDYAENELKNFPFEQLLIFLIQKQGCPGVSCVSLSFVSNETIQRLNRDYRGIDKPTDVLSFECDNIPFENEALDKLPEYELGDIIVAPDIALAQTKEYGTTFEEELTLLIVHGFLHLIGYDHMSDDEAEVMEERERELITLWNETNHD